MIRPVPAVLRQTGPIGERRIRIRVSLLLVRDARVYLLRSVFGGSELWCLSGGGVEWGETLEEAARREAREELATDVEIGQLATILDLISPDGDFHCVEVVFHATTAAEPVAQAEPLGEGEVAEGEYGTIGAWFDEDRLRTTNAYPRELLARLFAGQSTAAPADFPSYLGNDW